MLTVPRAEGLGPVVAAGPQDSGDSVQVAEASLALIGADEAELVRSLCLGEGVTYSFIHLFNIKLKLYVWRCFSGWKYTSPALSRRELP